MTFCSRLPWGVSPRITNFLRQVLKVPYQHSNLRVYYFLNISVWIWENKGHNGTASFNGGFNAVRSYPAVRSTHGSTGNGITAAQIWRSVSNPQTVEIRRFFACTENRCVRNTDLLPTVTEENGKRKKKPRKLDEHSMYIIQEDVFCLHSVNVRALKDRQRGSVFVVSPVFSSLGVSGAPLQLRSLWFCTLQLSHCCGVHSSSSSVVVLSSFFACFFVVCICGKLGFFYKKEFLACLRGFFSCSAVSSIQLEVIPVPRILVAVVRQVFFSWSVVWVPQISHWKFLGPESCFLWTQGECSFLWRKKGRKDGFVPGEGERGSDKGATTVGRLTTLPSWSLKTQWRNNEFARSRWGGDDRNDGTVCGFGGFIGLSDGSPVACSSARASARSCGASNQSRIHHRPRHSICHVVHGACVDVHYPSSWCYPLLSFLERWCRHFEETLGTYLIDS